MLVCDICGKPATDTIILYTKKIDHCEDCKVKAGVLRKSMKNSIEYYMEEAHKNILAAEVNILKKKEEYISKKRKEVRQYDLEGNLIKRWTSLTEAAETLGIDAGSICDCYKGERKTVDGYVWKRG